MRILAKTLLAFLLLLGVAAAGAWFYYQSALARTLHFTHTYSPMELEYHYLDNVPNILYVKPGDGVKEVAENLVASKVLKEPYTFILHAFLKNKHRKIQAGFYELTSDMTIDDVLEKLANGKVIVHTFTLIEGQTVDQMLRRIEHIPHFGLRNFSTSKFIISEALGLPEDQLEGWFAPDTYQFRHRTLFLVFLKRMHQAQRDILKALWENRDPNLPLESPYQALILASIIEKETNIDSERAQIAGVFVRRLQLGMPLQTDPTVIYGAIQNGTYEGKLTKALLREDTPYNTYTRKGLPPTPIANPSRQSIEAALHPDKGTALFFMAKKGGGHTFSDTYEQHQQAVKAYYSE